MDWLPLTTTLVNLAGVVVSLWLGLYVVTRSVYSRIAWLAALTLWSVGTWFLHNALQGGVTTQVWTDWLGQAMKLSVPLWFHLTCRVRFAIAPPRPTLRRVTYFFIVLSYGLMLFQMLESSGVFGTDVSWRIEGMALHFEDRWTTGSFPIFLALVAILPAFAIFNLAQGRSQTEHPFLRRQLSLLILATAIAYIGGLFAAVGALPVFPADAILGLGIFVLAYAVAEYNALLEGRPVVSDALYSAFGVLTVVTIYSWAALLLYRGGHITLQAVVAIVVLAIITHALYDGGRSLLDRLFYHAHARRLRAELRALAAEAGQAGVLTTQLAHLLERLCHTLGVKDALIAVRGPTALTVVAATVPEWRTQVWPLDEADALGLLDDTIAPPFSPELQELALLVPLPGEGEPVGLLALGPKSSGDPLQLEDLEYVETLAPQLGMMLWDGNRQRARAEELDRLVGEFREREREYQHQLHELLAQHRPEAHVQGDRALDNRLHDETRLVPLVEDALRHLHDYAYLGRHALAELQIVRHYLATNEPARALGLTHVDRGKALYEVLVQTIQSLQPGDGKLAPPGRLDIAPREWHPYLILHECYVRGESTNEIRARLYIGEGTYNRTRRSALRSVAHSLQELELAQSAAAPPPQADATRV